MVPTGAKTPRTWDWEAGDIIAMLGAAHPVKNDTVYAWAHQCP